MTENYKQISVTTTAGKVLTAFEGDEITRQIQLKGEYDGRALASMRDVLAQIRPKTSLDIGANIGNHAVVIADFTQQLAAFEPLPFIFSVLQTNLERNVGKRATCFNVALSDNDATLHMNIASDGNFGSSSVQIANDAVEVETISAVVGDEFLTAQNISEIDFIKIDVEGHEAPALTGLSSTILRDQPLVMLEWSHPDTLAGFAELQLFDTLFKGYRGMAITSSDSTKLYPRTLVGRIRRLFGKASGRKWCLTDFDPTKHYSNVYLIPARYSEVFSQWRYMPTIRN